MDKTGIIEEEILFDEKTAALLVRDAAALVIKKLVVDQNIRLDDEQMQVLARTSAKHINLEIDYPGISENVIKHITELKDSTALFMSEAVRGDLFERIKKEVVLTKQDKQKIAEDAFKLLPSIKDGKDGEDGKAGAKGENYILTEQDKTDIASTVKPLISSVKGENQKITTKIRADIAEKAVDNLLNSKEFITLLVNAVIASDQIISRESVTKKFTTLRQMIDRVSVSGKSGKEGGISGKAVVGAINKTLGNTTWQSGGGGAADLLISTIIKPFGSTLAANELQKTIEFRNTSGDEQLRIDPNATVPIPIGSWFVLQRAVGAQEVTLRLNSPGVLRSVLGDQDIKVDGFDGFGIFVQKTATDTWLASGSIKDV